MIKLKSLISEEYIGDLKNNEVFKDPKSIKRMAPELRGYSHPNGDFYVIDDAYQVTHSMFAKWLNQNLDGFNTPDNGSNTGLVKAIKKGYITWQRDGSTNTFKLAESINWGDPEYYKKNDLIPFLSQYAKIVRRKNPQYKFVLKRIHEGLLNEELLGTMNNVYEVYKNPKTITRMEAKLRGISFPNGDLFVIDDARNVIHLDLSNWLRANGYKMPAPYWANKDLAKLMRAGYLGWQRNGKTNELWISESMDYEDALDGEIGKAEYIKLVKKIIAKVKPKNPSIKFVPKSIWGLYGRQ